MLENFTGQREAITPLMVAIAASRRTGRSLPNALFLGGPGRGKTTLAKAVADELELPFVTLHGSSTIERQSIADKIMEAKGGILFIDEIHALPRQICEDLYRVIDEGKLSVSIPKVITTWKEQAEWVEKKDDLPENSQWLWRGPYYYMVPVATSKNSRETETILMDVGPITVLGATTDEALLPEPFYSRLSSLIVRLQPYSLMELATIAQDHATSLDMKLDDDAATLIALRSGKTPRRVKQLTERAADWVVSMYATDLIEGNHAKDMLNMIGVDQHGLQQPHRDIMRVLSEHQNGLSRTSLAQNLRIPPRNVEHYWADLSEAGFVTIDTRHRITEEGRHAYSG